MKSSSLLVAFFLAMVGSSGVGAQSDRCISDIFRVVGRNQVYLMPCRCDGSINDYVARAAGVLGDSPNTAAQARETVACLESRRRSLAENCDQFPDAYEINTRRAIRECLDDVRPPEDAPDFNATFTFDKSMCRPVFRRVDVGPRAESVVACACEQRPSYAVHPGLSQFFDVDSPTDVVEERELIRDCVLSQFATLEDTCKREPERFELLSLQLMNTCCKRARVMFGDAKHRCQETVPDNVSEGQVDVIMS